MRIGRVWEDVASGVLDVIYQMVEWPSQPLRFESSARPLDEIETLPVIIALIGGVLTGNIQPRQTTGVLILLRLSRAYPAQYCSLLNCRESSVEPRLLPLQARL